MRNAKKGSKKPPELSIILPCLNEERTVGACVRDARAFLDANCVEGEVIVADNGSMDRSAEVARRNGAVVAHVAEKGYGYALRGGFNIARGKFIIMADADRSYDLLHLMPFLEKLRAGYELVMGNRFQGGIKKNAMPWHHRYIGNPALSAIGRLFFHTPARDFHCGLRGFSKQAMQRMNLKSGGMELASEIVIKASLLNMKVCEVPTTLSPDGRDRPPHLRSFQDGWRHLRFLLVYSPRWLFSYPGFFLFTAGCLLSIALFFGPIDIGFRLIDFHSFIVTGTMTVLGINMLAFSAITGVYAFNVGLLPNRPGFYSLFKYFNLEKGLALGLIVSLLGLILIIKAVTLSSEFSLIGFNQSVRLVYGGSLALSLGAQIVLISFALSILGLEVTRQ